MTAVFDMLEAAGACVPALVWSSKYHSPQDAWDACPRGDWMAWWLGRLAEPSGDGSPEHRRAVLAACRCARTDPRLSEPGVRALDLIEAWAQGGEDRRKEASEIAVYDASLSVVQCADAALRADAASAACYVAANEAVRPPDLHTSKLGAVANLAALIRDAVPVVPLPSTEAP